jgi:hypothetical protein
MVAQKGHRLLPVPSQVWQKTLPHALHLLMFPPLVLHLGHLIFFILLQ